MVVDFGRLDAALSGGELTPARFAFLQASRSGAGAGAPRSPAAVPDGLIPVPADADSRRDSRIG
jgi:hypothetical protein